MKNQFIPILRVIAIAGNLLFIFWILYNGISEGFKGTIPEKMSYIGLMILLALNTLLIFNREKQPQDKNREDKTTDI